MHNFGLFLKTQITVLNLLLFLLLLAFIFSRFQKRRLVRIMLYATVLTFLLCATNYLPYYLAKKLEHKYLPFDIALYNAVKSNKVFIHVLGNDYKLDKGLPATSMLGLGSLARLTEAVRINRLLDSSIIVCSGTGPKGAESQAEVTKRAAVLLGIDSSRAIILTTPSTTAEEVKALAKKAGHTVSVIVVTEAIHMPRAMMLFRREGFDAIAAPTNFKTNKAQSSIGLGWIPTIENMDLMNRVIHEYLATLNAGL